MSSAAYLAFRGEAQRRMALFIIAGPTISGAIAGHITADNVSTAAAGFHARMVKPASMPH